MEIEPVKRRRSQIWMITALSVMIFLTAGLWFWLRGMQRELRASAELADFGKVPDVTLTERSGRKISLGELRGKIWIADFIFTRCGGSCLLMSQKMSDLQKSLVKTKDVQLVSFTVDPEHDTPEVLDDYSKRYNADNDRWLFFRTSASQMKDLAVNTFHLALQEGRSEEEPITHSTRFVLVDADGHIRGYYNSEDAESQPKLLTDLGMLMRSEEK
jgi:protein SCO1/2